MLLVIDNYDSFTYNLVHYAQEMGAETFEGLEDPFNATRYHSLSVERDSLPECLIANAWVDDGEIMGIRHKTKPIHGLQFHPESIASENGHALIGAFLKIAGISQ